jgi:alpha-glucosidase
LARKLVHRRRLADGERLYGLGDKAWSLDRRGGVFELWNTDNPNYARGHDPLYKAIPLVFGVSTERAWALLVESTGRLVFDCRSDELRVFADRSVPVREWEGERLSDLLADVSAVVGRTPMPPRWALGYHQSRWSYASADEVRRVVAGFRERRIPLDAVHLDIAYMDGYRVFTWDESRFPDPAGLVDELHATGVRVVTIIDPGVKAEPGYRVYNELVERRLYCAAERGKPWIGRVWPGMCAFPDFSDPAARAWWGEQHREHVEAGVDGIWIDMNEPSAGHRGTLPEDLRQKAGLHRDVHNAYGHWMAQATYEGLRALRPGVPPFVLTRAGCAGTQRFAATWTGDNRSTWTHLRLSLGLMLGLGLSCYPFSGSDVGGFAGRCEPELYARWMQLGAFSPFFRTHYAGALTAHAQEPWSFGRRVEAVARAAIELRHELLDETVAAFERHETTGLPVMRALAVDFQDDERALDVEDEFLWGDSLLVAPVVRKGAQRRRVYLPAGEWTDRWTDRRYEGPRHVTVAAPLDRIPLFRRASY